MIASILITINLCMLDTVNWSWILVSYCCKHHFWNWSDSHEWMSRFLRIYKDIKKIKKINLMSSVSIEAKAKKKKLVYLWILTVFIYSLILNSAAHVPEDIKHPECLMISKNIGHTPLHHFKLALARSYLTETQLLSYLARHTWEVFKSRLSSFDIKSRIHANPSCAGLGCYVPFIVCLWSE